MKTATKLLMGAAVMAGSVGAAQAGATLPSTDNSQLLFFVNDTANSTTYTAILTQTINGSGGYFTTADAQTSGASATSVNTINGDNNFTYSFAADSALQTFITNAGSANLQWGIISGAYSGVSQSARSTNGNTLFVTTGATSPIGFLNETALTNGAPTSYNTDVKSLNIQTFDAFSGTTNGIFGTPSSHNGAALTLEGTGYNEAGLAIGTTAYNVYGITSNGTNAQGLAFDIGTASFNGTTLVFDGNTGGGGSSVPLPAAAWLFGSGLLGLLGIGRRRESFAVAA